MKFLLLVSLLISPLTADAAQWIVIDKSTNIAAGVHNHETAPEVDASRYDLIRSQTDVIVGEPAVKFRRNTQGQIVKRSRAELEANFDDERRSARIAQLNAQVDAVLTLSAEEKAVLKQIIREAVR